MHLRFQQVGERYGSAYPFERYVQYVAFKTGVAEVQVYLSMKAQFEIYNPETEAAEKAYSMRLRELELQEKELVLESRRHELSLNSKKK